MRGEGVAVVFLLAVIAACAPNPDREPAVAPRPTPTPDALLDSLGFTAEQLRAFLAAGLEIQKGIVPSRTLPADQLAALAEIDRTLAGAVCSPTASAESCARYRVDVPRCIDRAGEIVAWRLRERDAVDRKLFIAAMGVSVTGREFPTFANIVRFCHDMMSLDGSAPVPIPRRS